MLSYQHAYHAGNLADVHKHALLAWMIGYLTQKDKPLSYIETHAGRGLYDLQDAAARKTGEAERGIGRAESWFADNHPYKRVLALTRTAHGPQSYPGSPMIAASLLRDHDRMDLAELHPQEHDALARAGLPASAHVHRRDGYELAHALVPPDPRRGLLVVDPSYEIKDDYRSIPDHVAKWTRAWNVGIIVLWYPILSGQAHQAMADRLTHAHPEALRHEVRFAPARSGHGMIGSGLFVINPPYGLEAEATWLKTRFDTL